MTSVDLSAVIDSPKGPRSVRDGLTFPALDLFVHGWDIGRTVGVDVVLPDDVIDYCRSVMEPLPDEQVRSPRVFASPATVPPDATPTQSFIAWTGRDPLWTPPHT